MSFARTYPVALETAFDAVLRMPLESVFSRRYGALPPIRATERTDGAPGEPWGQVGQARVVRLSDGGSMRESLVAVERPEVFGYELDRVKGAMAALVSSVDGSWAFAAAGTGTRVTWTWHVHPRSPVTAPLLGVLAKLWRGYARQAFEQLESALVPA
jgi:hypothetical protein